MNLRFFFSFSGLGETESTWYVGHCWPIVPAPDDRWWWLWSSWWNENWQGKPKYSEKTSPSATLCTTNPTWPDLGSNPGRRGGKPATNHLSYGTANLRFIKRAGSFLTTCMIICLSRILFHVVNNMYLHFYPYVSFKNTSSKGCRSWGCKCFA
jgi:hypothetical protein